LKIDLSYQGAVAARQANNFQTYIANRKQEDPLAGKEVEVSRNGEAVKLTFSKEWVEFKTDVGFAADINAQQADPDDIFSYKPQDQWLVFSQYLSDSKQFDSLSMEQMNELESALQHITDGLDSLTQTGMNFFGGVKTQLSSYEARLELASSSAALAYFSDKYLSGDVKEGFDQLTAQYVDHNTKKLANYQSLEEKFYAARSKLNSDNSSLSADSASQLSVTNKLGSVKHSAQELDEIMQVYNEQFKGINQQSDLSNVLQNVREQLLQFVTKSIPSNEKSNVQNFVNQGLEETFQRLDGYWSKLTSNKEMQ